MPGRLNGAYALGSVIGGHGEGVGRWPFLRRPGIGGGIGHHGGSGGGEL